MTQGFHPPLRWLACAALVAAAALSPAVPVLPLLAAAPAFASAGDPAAAPDPATASASATASDVPQEAYEELAGNAAGAGRERPGQPATASANPETVIAARPVPLRPPPARPVTPTPSAAPSLPAAGTALGAEPNERAADLAAHILPLGTGFALMGLGLGFMGMRLRKGP
ncbi:hypothetical protein ACFWBF_28140 [Streptomyces sp. NPDC060028]|uniref:hypothetical protein n=1 Tax=Streptomyces sp. NPDC060028 TaxID=3347041 RepID=UPI0036A57CAA